MSRSPVAPVSKRLLRGVIVLGAAIAGFVLAAMASFLVYGMLAPVGALVAANAAIAKTRPLVGEGPPRRVPLLSQAVQWQAIAVVAGVVTAWVLWEDGRLVARDRAVLVLALLSTLVPALAAALRVTLWRAYAVSAAGTLSAAIATAAFGGLGFLAAAGPSAIAALLSALSRSDRALPGESASYKSLGRVPLAELGIGLSAALAAAVFVFRSAFAPAGTNELAGNAASALTLLLPALLAWRGLRARPRLVCAAACAGLSQGLLGLWAWAAWASLASSRADPAGPPWAFAYAALLPASLFWPAWRERRRMIPKRSAWPAAAAAAIFALPPVVALSAVRDWGCGRNGCTDDFVSAPEALAATLCCVFALVVVQAVDGLGLPASGRRERT